MMIQQKPDAATDPTHVLDLAATSGSNGSSTVTFVCSCGEKFKARSWELAFEGYRKHRDETDAAMAAARKLETGKEVIVTRKGHKHFDRIGKITTLGDTTAFVDFDGESVLVSRDAIEACLR